MSARGWAACAAVAVVMLSGCNQRAEPAMVTVTKTVAPRQADREPILDERACEQIRTMREANRELAQDGYAEDYTAQYDRQLRAGGCSP